jgi:hypothetical protein
MDSVLHGVSPASVAHFAAVFSSVWAWAFGWLAALLLISGIDDFIPLAVCAAQHFSKKPLPSSTLGEIINRHPLLELRFLPGRLSKRPSHGGCRDPTF